MTDFRENFEPEAFDAFSDQFGEEPRKHRTVLISAFEGWNDAGLAATQALHFLLRAYSQSAHEVDHICCGSFYDYTDNRPVIVSVEGKRKILWPETSFTQIDINPELSLIIQIAPEPNFKWTEYCQRTLRIADENEVDEVITVSAIYGDCTHRRSLPMVFHNAADNTATPQSYNGPIGIPTVLSYEAVDSGFISHSMYVSVPSYAPYVDNQEKPNLLAMWNVIDALSDYLDVYLKDDGLPEQVKQWRKKANALARTNPDIAEYMKTIESYRDNQERLDYITSEAAENMIDDAEKFLRDFGWDKTDDAPDMPGSPRLR